MRIHAKSTLLYLAIAVVLIGVIVFEGQEIRHHIDLIGSWILSIGPWGVVVFMALYILTTSLFFPESLLSILAGSIYGIVTGLAAVVAASVVAAALQFLLSEYLLYNPIRRKIAKRPKLAAIQHAVKRDAFHLQMLLRLVPFNPATISYMLGATGVPFPGFLLATLFLTPVLFVEVYFGHTGKHILQSLWGGSGGSWVHDLLLTGGFLVCVAILFLISKIARNAIQAAVESSKDS